MKADLHIHSLNSDGTDTPEEIVKKAAEKGLEVISITDHDNVRGVKKGIECGRENNVDVITGIELSTITKREIHILGYGYDMDNTFLMSKFEYLLRMRQERNSCILKKLKKFNIFISDEEINNIDDNVSGRLHIALAMRRKGYVGGIGEAFDKYLSYGKPAYVAEHRLQTKEAVKLIAENGGVPVLAHPVQIRSSKDEIERLVKNLKDVGLMGIEVFYFSHSKTDIEFYGKLADKYNLIKTGGSDYHGSSRIAELGSVDFDLSKDTLAILKKQKNN